MGRGGVFGKTSARGKKKVLSDGVIIKTSEMGLEPTTLRLEV